MKLLLVLMSGMVVNASCAAMPPAAGAGLSFGSFAQMGADRKKAQEPEAPPAYSTPTSKAARGSEAPPPCTPLSVMIPNDPTQDVIVVVPASSAPSTPVPKSDSKRETELVDLRDGSTALVHVVAAAAAVRNNLDADLGPVSTKWCLSNLTDQELETEIIRAQAWYQKWSQEYHDFTAKISAEEHKIAQARNNQALEPAAIHAIVTAATIEKDRLDKLLIEHNKALYPYRSTAVLERVKQVREHNNSKDHLCCLARWCESKPVCCFSYCDCTRQEIIKYSLCLCICDME